MKKNILVFYADTARWESVEDPSIFEGAENVLINPKVSHLRLVPMEYWKKIGDLAVSMTPSEIVERQQLSQSFTNVLPPRIVEKIKEVPVEVIREVEKIVEIVREVPVEVIKEVTKEIPIEVIKETPIEVIKTVEVIKEVPVDVIREVVQRVEVPVLIPRTPLWAWGLIFTFLFSTAGLAFLLLQK